MDVSREGANSVDAPATARLGGGVAAPARLCAGIAAVLALAVAVALALQPLVAFRITINWDEFWFLARVHEQLRGALEAPLQTFHVHLFAWLPQVAAEEIGQIIAGRLTMAALTAGSAVLVYGLARRFVSPGAALFGVLAYVSFSIVIAHGASFRADPLATFLNLLGLFVLLRRLGSARGGMVGSASVGAALAGAVMAVAMLVTIKSVFYLVVVAGAILCLAPGWRARARLILAFGAAFALVGGVLYALHSAALAPPSPGEALATLEGSASKVFLEDGPFPRRREFLFALILNPLFWLMAVAGAALAARAALRRRDEDGGVLGDVTRGERWLPLVLALPLLTPFFYRNAFVYYYVFIVPPGAVLAALLFERYWARIPGRDCGAALVVAVLTAAQCAMLAANAAPRLEDRMAAQRAALDVVHEVFPEPVPYIDGYGVVAGFPRHGFFMSTWGMDSYRARGRAVFPDIVARGQPPLLLANGRSLHAAFEAAAGNPDTGVPESQWLLPEDAAFLTANYVRHWGMLYVAGKRIGVLAGGGNASFDIVVAGDYRLEAAGSVVVDGTRLAPGDIVSLTRGAHTLMAAGAPGDIVLRWAKALPPPDVEPVNYPAFFNAARWGE